MSLSFNANNSVSRLSLKNSIQEKARSTVKLATGKRVNFAADDVASLSISAKLDSQLRGIDSAMFNLNDAISFVDAQQAMVNDAQDKIKSLYEISVKAFNGTNSEAEHAALQQQFNEIVLSMDSDIVILNPPKETFYINGLKLSDTDADVRIQSGFNDNQIKTMLLRDNLLPNQGINLETTANSAALGVITEGIPSGRRISEMNIGSATIASVTGGYYGRNIGLDDFNVMMKNVNRMASELSAYRVHFETKISFLDNLKQSMSQYQSHVMDADIAEESANFMREEIKSQTATAILSQANLNTNVFLGLLP